MNSNASMIAELKRLYGHFSPARRWQLGAIFLLMLVGAVAEMAALGSIVPFLAVFTNRSLVERYPLAQKLFMALGWGGGKGLLLYASILFGFAAVGAAAVRAMIYWACTRFIYGLGADIGGEVYNRILHQPYSFHVANNTSTIIAGLNKTRNVTQVINSLLQGLVALVLSIAIMAILIRIDPSTALVAMVSIFLLYVSTTLFTARRLKTNGAVIATNESRRVQVVQEGMGGIRDVLLDGNQGIFVNRFQKFDYAQRRAQAANMIISEFPRYFIQAMGIVLIISLALWLGRRNGGLVTVIPLLGALALGAQRLLPQMQQLYATWATVRGAHATLVDVLALLEQPIPPEYLQIPAHDTLHLTDRVALRDVSFRYRPDTPNVIDRLSFDIPRGSRLGLIGTTGSGKSTLIDLVMGLLEPTGGSIAIDGQTLDRTNRRAWQANIAHVPQAIYLADSSIAENIAFGVEPGHIDLERVRDAAEMAQLTDFIESLPQKYETYVGERGIRLSGGQRQRIGIARALYKRADLLVLDEATSALDDTTEELVLNAIEGLGPEITVLMIAHRLTTLKQCSSVIELEAGKIVWSGSYQDVLKREKQFNNQKNVARDAIA